MSALTHNASRVPSGSRIGEPWRTRAPNLAVIGATGAVGTTLLSLFDELAVPIGHLDLVASERSAGRTLPFRGREHPVRRFEDVDFSQVDIAFFSAGTERSRTWAREVAERGALVIDNTNAHRMDPDTPLIVPQVNADLLALRPASGIIANPNCSTISIARLMAPLERHFRVTKLVISTYQAASGAGLKGQEDLRCDARGVLAGEDDVHAGRFAVPLAFNVVPSIDILLDSGFTLEEQKMAQETQKILRRSELQVSTTAVRVPVLNGHAAAVYFECERPMERARLVALLQDAPEVIVYDGLGPASYPTPRFLSDANRVHVGRIRVETAQPTAGWLWVCADNLRIGAALNALQIAIHVLANATWMDGGTE
ncbi:aspartate-semialdehyde dehydrogenase [Haliangium ochraceum]|uniref:Aspartate-semialdehyde dehydrogenase n=1 Tax=Haliangium ochraceum (strain DSM 14365 / JCM 11303 / SMP-2) TaxID=502025 RepID=D0LLF0_HALO1|nr:aspartate-semialdehyde dehydrogenase [Haliangium ochraceum]ACY18646.1 aspartate-semialdehyde dehydrogenase [Haliangium ochraceum DSM 14365]